MPTAPPAASHHAPAAVPAYSCAVTFTPVPPLACSHARGATLYRSHLVPLLHTRVPTCARSHFHAFPLPRVPTCARSHFHAFPLPRVPTSGPFPLPRVPTCARSHLGPLSPREFPLRCERRCIAPHAPTHSCGQPAGSQPVTAKSTGLFPLRAARHGAERRGEDAEDGARRGPGPVPKPHRSE